jgi:hypothetical protein
VYHETIVPWCFASEAAVAPAEKETVRGFCCEKEETFTAPRAASQTGDIARRQLQRRDDQRTNALVEIWLITGSQPCADGTPIATVKGPPFFVSIWLRELDAAERKPLAV